MRFGAKPVSDRRVKRLVNTPRCSGNDYIDADGTVWISHAVWKHALAETRVHTARGRAQPLGIPRARCRDRPSAGRRTRSR